MKIVWSPEAIQDLISLRAYIAEESPVGARRIVLRILHGVEHLLPDNPQMGRPGRVPGTRELVIPQIPYIVPYCIQRARPSRFCASSMALGDGRTAFNQLLFRCRLTYSSGTAPQERTSHLAGMGGHTVGVAMALVVVDNFTSAGPSSIYSYFFCKPGFDQRLIGHIAFVSGNFNALKESYRQA
jgi:toxin ParE1/3/4